MAFTQGHALIIGVGEYTHHPEANIPLAAGDAGEVARVLVEKKSCGYLPGRVCLLTNQSATRGAVLQALADLSGAGPEDTVFLFYSGHGAPGTDGNYHLSTCDTHFSDGKIKDFALSEGELLGLLRGIPARRMVLLIQACYSGELSPHFGPEAPAAVESAGLPDRTADAILGSGEGRIIITSSRASQRSWGRAAEKTSLFARALVDGLRGEGWVANNAGFIGAFGLYEYVHETVKEAARAIGQEQEPVLSALELVGPFPLALYHGASDQGEYDPAEPLPGDAPVRRVSEKISRRLFERRVVYTNGGPYFEKVSTGGGEFAQKLNKLQADTISGGIQAVGDGIVIYPPADPEEAARKLREKNRQAYLEGLYAACQEMRFAPLGGDDSELVDFTLNDVYIELDTETPVVQKGDSAGGRGLDVPGTLLVPRGKNEAVFSALGGGCAPQTPGAAGRPGLWQKHVRAPPALLAGGFRAGANRRAGRF